MSDKAKKKLPNSVVGGTVGLPLDREVSTSVDWAGLSANIIEFISKTAFGVLVPASALSGTSNLLSAVKSIKTDMSISEKTWHIAMLSLGWAINEVAVVQSDDGAALKKAVTEIIKIAGERVDAGKELAPVNFIERPTQLPLYKFLRSEIVKRKSLIRAGVNEADSVLESKLDASYDRAVFEVFVRRPELFDALIDSLSSKNVAAAAQKQIDWDSYRQRLLFDFSVRLVFGQELTKLSLEQLYVPLRGFWRCKDSDDADQLVDSRSAHFYEYAWIEETLESWLATDDASDVIRLIGGGPGSGKSTTLRSFASKLAARPDFRPLFIPLQHISLDGDLRDAINRYFAERTNGDFHHPPLGRNYVEDGPPLVLLFDGLDEIARPGEAANEVVGLFSAKLANLVTALRGDGVHNLKVVVTGRMPAFQAAKRYLSPPREGCIEVHGYTPVEGRPNASELESIDQRGVWWGQYASLTGMSAAVPPAFRSDRLQGLTHEPLLCYLLVLSGFAISNWERAAENPNIIYRQLVDSIWDRGWGEGAVKRQGAGRSLSRSDFNLLMQTIAIAAWQGGDTRVASESGFEAAIRIARADSAWESFKNDNGPDVTNLAMNFYLKSAEEGHRGFEFTHKSFGDYLAARSILDIALELPPVIARKVDHALVDWVEATSTGVLTREIHQFLKDEVRLRISEGNVIASTDAIVKAKKSFEVLLSTALADGMPVMAAGNNWRMAENHQANAESMAWAIVNALSLALVVGRPDERLVRVDWPSPRDSFGDVLSRLTRGALRDNPVLKCFSNIVAPNAFLFGLVISGIDLRGAQMENTNFNGCHLLNADLSGGYFSESSFERAMLDSANLQNSVLTDCNFVDARFTHARLDGANMRDSVISPLTVIHSSLEDFVKLGPVFRFEMHGPPSRVPETFWKRVSASKRAMTLLRRENDS